MNCYKKMCMGIALIVFAGGASAQPLSYTEKSETGIIRVKALRGDLKEARIAIAWGDRLKPPAQYPRSIINLRDAMVKWTNIPVTIGNHVRLGTPDIHKYPILIISTSDQFDLTETEIRNLQEYIKSGGFVVADGNMSDPSAAALLQMVRELSGNGRLQAIPIDHPIYQSPFTIGGPPRGNIAAVMPSNSPGRAALTDEVVGLQGVFIDGRLAVLYSPRGYYGRWNDWSNDAYLKFGVNLILYAIGGS